MIKLFFFFNNMPTQFHSFLKEYATKIYYPGEIALRWSTNATCFLGPVANYLRMDSARNAVMQFCVKLRQLVSGVYASFGYIPDSSRFDNVTNNKFLYRFILGYATSAIGATNGINVSTTVFSTAPISAFAGLQNKKRQLTVR